MILISTALMLIRISSPAALSWPYYGLLQSLQTVEVDFADIGLSSYTYDRVRRLIASLRIRPLQKCRIFESLGFDTAIHLPFFCLLRRYRSWYCEKDESILVLYINVGVKALIIMESLNMDLDSYSSSSPSFISKSATAWLVAWFFAAVSIPSSLSPSPIIIYGLPHYESETLSAAIESIGCRWVHWNDSREL